MSLCATGMGFYCGLLRFGTVKTRRLSVVLKRQMGTLMLSALTVGRSDLFRIANIVSSVESRHERSLSHPFSMI